MIRLLIFCLLFAFLADRYHQPIDASSGKALVDSSVKAAPVVVVEGTKEATTIAAQSGVPAAKKIAEDLKTEAQKATVEVHRTQPTAQPAEQIVRRKAAPKAVESRCPGYGQPDAVGNLNYCL